MTIGERIHDLRKAKRLTLQQLGDKVGVSASAISFYEKGKREPSFDMISCIAEALDTFPAKLMYGWDEDFFALHPELRKDLAPHLPLSDNETALLAAFARLNPDGQRKALERVEELSEVPKYQRGEQLPRNTVKFSEPSLEEEQRVADELVRYMNERFDSEEEPPEAAGK